MKTNRLTPPIVAAIGIVLSLMAIGGIFYFLIKPTQDSLDVQQARYTSNYPDSTPAAQKNAQNLLNKNKIKVQQIKFQWAQVEAALMPPYDVSDRQKAWRQLTYELGHYLGPDLARQMKTTGVASTAAFALPAPPANANDITGAPLVIPLGTINVNGSFRQILTHFYEWQYFNRLVMVDGLTLDGNSPFMAGSYNATLYIFPQNDDQVAVTNPKAGGAAAGSAAPTGFPGGGGGYPGGGGGGYPGGGGRPGGYPGGRPGG